MMKQSCSDVVNFAEYEFDEIETVVQLVRAK